ncbi:MAG: methylenetetrahydrofolate--tRNA-(uracil(54)-C(5))-methyltransferase (FADH(2)-oxidizing) TrmFO [Candidatus Syntrophonatronum acetioxidans]|uniref:Methylenetetrahydrofolate--tRNA-(uracil-5-)-methyltransferase TrmFO n=1 Tax=Candidatus Syntrophonatronum acetioxidans TaxID=1795816 RepID=A0A424Y9N2_9FIRM|nr:MAG: methylenetetrahydrofolate--tRNA-(uracil(54)-C(5))-methyltransferase (FADH(2)-oxidizing) TrmFO [Candidatus Syntrophonatronum acetioxidans]
MAEPGIIIVGGGLAGSEAAWQAAQRGVKVTLYEMRPKKMTPAHHTGLLSELVCSNSLRAEGLENAAGLLKEEMRKLNSLVISSADKNRVPAGKALAVDRDVFASYISKALVENPLVEIVREEVTQIPEEGVPVIVATGPLTSSALAEEIKKLTGSEHLYFYDAAAPIVTRDSIDMDKVFRASRYDRGTADYLNCPMTEEEYNRFWKSLIEAERHQMKEFEKETYFEGCMPVEEMASRGLQTLLYGPMKPVGLVDPRTGEQPYAVVQLRQDNLSGTLYNLVGFQTSLTWPEQKRVFCLIPGLENAEFVRFGVMHRNTFINSPLALKPTLQLKKNPHIFFSGQITGVEGYVESTSSGLIAGINAANLVQGKELLVFPKTTAHGALCHYITTADPNNFQPMNVNFGLLPPPEKKVKGRERKIYYSQRALEDLSEFIESLGN